MNKVMKLLDFIKTTEHRSQQLKRGWDLWHEKKKKDKKHGGRKK